MGTKTVPLELVAAKRLDVNGRVHLPAEWRRTLGIKIKGTVAVAFRDDHLIVWNPDAVVDLPAGVK